MTEKIPKIAILLAAFNGRDWLQEQIDSILAQKNVDVSIYINVDRSSDGTESLVDKLTESHPQIYALPHGQHFGSAGQNFFYLLRCVNFLNYDYISFSDQDDLWRPNKLAKAVSEIKKNQVDAYSSNITAFWPGGKRLFIDKAQPQVKWDFLFEAAGPGCTYVISKNLAQHLQSFLVLNLNELKQITLHDWFVYAFSRANGYRWFIDSYSSLLYRQHTSNHVGANSGFLAFKKRGANVLNGWWLSQSLLIANAIGLNKNLYLMNFYRGTRISYCRLGLHFLICRRRNRDKFLFLLACICLAILPTKVSYINKSLGKL
jgi:rhamnosyltransferase